MGQILYNVTINIDDDVREDWLNWMKSIHIPEVMATGCFVNCRMFLIEKHNPSDPGTNYGVQYFAESMDDYVRYNRDFAPLLKQKAIDRYGSKFLAFRTLLHEIPL